MSKFTIFISIHNESGTDRDELNKVMNGYGFARTITSDGGKTYELPVGLYSYTGVIDRKSLLEMTRAAAGQIGKKYSILITESKGRSWHNLEENVGI